MANEHTAYDQNSQHRRLVRIAREVEDLQTIIADLQALGEEADLPVVERTAWRLQGVVAQLDENFPPELER